jgi:signal transduction histidine kinase
LADGPAQDSAAASDPDKARIEALVCAERTRALHERLGISQATVMFNSAVVALVFWGKIEASRLLAWVATVWIVAAGRLLLRSAYRRADPMRDATRWGRVFTLGAAVNGLAWGAAPLLLLHDGLSLPHALFLAFVLGGMAAGAALSNASHQPAFLAFAVPALVPITGELLLRGDRLEVAMGFMVAVFGAAVSGISRAGGRALAEAVRLRFRNGDLAERLANAAAELERRVVERTSQLEAALSREREAERRLSHAARLASLGTLAAGVAHEINNPLTYIRSNLGFVREELDRVVTAPDARAAVSDAIRDATEGVERVSLIVRRLTDLSRVQLRRGLEPVELQPAIDACVAMAGPEIRTRATLVRDYAAAPKVMGERTQLVQVFLNLLMNAADAIPEGNPDAHTIRISTRLDELADEVVVEVADTGAGIPESILDRVWDPFFTTKAAGWGTGLGLSISKSIVASLGGRIAVRSREGAGSTFTVWLKTAARRA